MRSRWTQSSRSIRGEWTAGWIVGRRGCWGRQIADDSRTERTYGRTMYGWQRLAQTHKRTCGGRQRSPRTHGWVGGRQVAHEEQTHSQRTFARRTVVHRDILDRWIWRRSLDAGRCLWLDQTTGVTYRCLQVKNMNSNVNIRLLTSRRAMPNVRTSVQPWYCIMKVSLV